MVRDASKTRLLTIRVLRFYHEKGPHPEETAAGGCLE
jgi:hypothetical protein